MKIRIKGITETGVLHLLIFKDGKGFPESEKDSAWSGTLNIDTVPFLNTLDISISKGFNPDEKVAVSVFLDTKRTGKLTKNFLGIPVCPVGLSNFTRVSDFYTSFRSFEKCSVKVSDSQPVVVELFSII
jgi:uncharacterized protein (DUF2141 family)